MYERKVLLGFIRVHILHHACEDEGIFGTWMMDELKEHGYRIGPGTLYPILHELEKDGALAASEVVVEGKIRKIYRITEQGEGVLKNLKGFIRELIHEVMK